MTDKNRKQKIEINFDLIAYGIEEKKNPSGEMGESFITLIREAEEEKRSCHI